ncbi:MAG: RNB domain-containing ribonuclease, partial [Planctomycetota bacterium]
SVELVFDEAGRVIDAEPEDDAFTHTIIEMFMVEANEAAARLFDKLDVPMIRRTHPEPDAHDVSELKQFARVAGYNIPSRPNRKELQQLLDAVRGKPQQQAVHIAVLRTMTKAEYSPNLIGHFALASEHYTHFTSPIRRYPDLIVHRGINAALEAMAEHPKNRKAVTRSLEEDRSVPDFDKLVEIGRHCSTTERNSADAERELRNYLVLELLAEQLGDDFAGTVSGVTGNGVFIQIDKYLVDGFVAVRELPQLPQDRWRFNRTTGALVAERSGKTITIGDRFTVRIASVDLARRQMDLAVVEPVTRSGRNKPAKPRRLAQGTSVKPKRSNKKKSKRSNSGETDANRPRARGGKKNAKPKIKGKGKSGKSSASPKKRKKKGH